MSFEWASLKHQILIKTFEEGNPSYPQFIFADYLSFDIQKVK